MRRKDLNSKVKSALNKRDVRMQASPKRRRPRRWIERGKQLRGRMRVQIQRRGGRPRIENSGDKEIDSRLKLHPLLSACVVFERTWRCAMIVIFRGLPCVVKATSEIFA